MLRQSIHSNINRRAAVDSQVFIEALIRIRFQVCRDLNDTKSKLERATDDLMSSQAAYQALEEQVTACVQPIFLQQLLNPFWQLQKTEEAAKSGGVLVLGGDEIGAKLQETLTENKKLERKIAELNTVVGQLRGQIKVLEAKLKDAALAQQSNVPEAILQLRGRWSSNSSSATPAGIDNASIIGSDGGLGIGMGIGGSSSSEVLQLRAEIEKCVRDTQRFVLYVPSFALIACCCWLSLCFTLVSFTLSAVINNRLWIQSCLLRMIIAL